MKKNILTVATIATSMLLTSCFGPNLAGTTQTGTTTGTPAISTESVTTAGASILGDLLGGLLSKTITERSFVGTWTYQKPEVRFESENLLIGELDVKEDKSYTIQTKGRTISAGTYTYDSNTQMLRMQGTFGLLNQECFVGMDGTNLCLLYDADKLLAVMNAAAGILGQTNSTLGSVAGVFGKNYNGMKVGFSLNK